MQAAPELQFRVSFPPNTWHAYNKIKVMSGFDLYTGVNGSPFLHTEFMFDQTSPWEYFLPLGRWATCLLSCFLLFGIRYVWYWMAIWCKCFISLLISFLGILIFFSSNSLIGCSWITPLTPVVMVMRGLTCQHNVLSVCMSGLYLVVFFTLYGIWEYVVAICELNELYDIWWRWC